MPTSAASCSCASISVPSGTGAASAGPLWQHTARATPGPAGGHLAAAWHRAAAAVMAWWSRRAGTGRELDTLVELSDSVLRDIGVPDGLRAQAAQRREQEHLLRRLDGLQGGSLRHW